MDDLEKKFREEIFKMINEGKRKKELRQAKEERFRASLGTRLKASDQPKKPG